MSQDYIPRREVNFNTWQDVFLTYLLANCVRFGLTTALIDPLITLQIAWRDAWTAATSPATRTKATIKAKDEAMKAYKAAIRKFVKTHLTWNDAVTDPDRDDLGLPIRDTQPTPAEIPQDVPEHEVRMSIARRLAFLLRAAGATGFGKPRGRHGIEMRHALLDAPPTEIEQLIHSEFTTTHTLTLDFRESERGKTLYYIFRWENTRGQKGPWTEIFHAIVP
jgi:hypothetical protein